MMAEDPTPLFYEPMCPSPADENDGRAPLGTDEAENGFRVKIFPVATSARPLVVLPPEPMVQSIAPPPPQPARQRPKQTSAAVPTDEEEEAELYWPSQTQRRLGFSFYKRVRDPNPGAPASSTQLVPCSASHAIETSEKKIGRQTEQLRGMLRRRVALGVASGANEVWTHMHRCVGLLKAGQKRELAQEIDKVEQAWADFMVELRKADHRIDKVAHMSPELAVRAMEIAEERVRAASAQQQQQEDGAPQQEGVRPQPPPPKRKKGRPRKRRPPKQAQSATHVVERPWNLDSLVFGKRKRRTPSRLIEEIEARNSAAAAASDPEQFQLLDGGAEDEDDAAAFRPPPPKKKKKNQQARPPHANKPWTSLDMQMLRMALVRRAERVLGGTLSEWACFEQIGLVLGRTAKAISKKTGRKGMRLRHPREPQLRIMLAQEGLLGRR